MQYLIYLQVSFRERRNSSYYDLCALDLNLYRFASGSANKSRLSIDLDAIMEELFERSDFQNLVSDRLGAINGESNRLGGFLGLHKNVIRMLKLSRYIALSLCHRIDH
jgi:hypothetical protein